MAGEAVRDLEYARLRAAVETARRALEAARRRGAGPTEIRLLTDRARAAVERLQRWRDAQGVG